MSFRVLFVLTPELHLLALVAGYGVLARVGLRRFGQ